MKKNLPCALFFLLFASCGYKGTLYLPDEDEDNSGFGPIQTGIGLEPKTTPSKNKLPQKKPSATLEEQNKYEIQEEH